MNVTCILYPLFLYTGVSLSLNNLSCPLCHAKTYTNNKVKFRYHWVYIIVFDTPPFTPKEFTLGSLDYEFPRHYVLSPR